MSKCEVCGKTIVASEDWGDYDDACEWACEDGCETPCIWDNELTKPFNPHDETENETNWEKEVAEQEYDGDLLVLQANIKIIGEIE